MESIGKIVKVKGKSKGVKIDVHLHSPAHVLADELSHKLKDERHFALYLGMAMKHDHNVLRKILGDVLEGKNVQNPGKLFAYLVKKYNAENKKVTGDK